MTKGQVSGRVPKVGPGIFAALAVHTGVLAVVYALFDDADRAGLALLGLAALAAAGFAVWLAVAGQEPAEDAVVVEAHGGDDPPPYLPTSSLAPLLLGGGTTLAIAGVPLGQWVLVPGLVLIGWGVAALARQSRDRS